MAGWDMAFDLAIDDVAPARGCFGVMRRTCARYFLEFTYYEEKRNEVFSMN
jgi:hypothetical protein